MRRAGRLLLAGYLNRATMTKGSRPKDLKPKASDGPTQRELALKALQPRDEGLLFEAEGDAPARPESGRASEPSQMDSPAPDTGGRRRTAAGHRRAAVLNSRTRLSGMGPSPNGWVRVINLSHQTRERLLGVVIPLRSSERARSNARHRANLPRGGRLGDAEAEASGAGRRVRRGEWRADSRAPRRPSPRAFPLCRTAGR